MWGGGGGVSNIFCDLIYERPSWESINDGANFLIFYIFHFEPEFE